MLKGLRRCGFLLEMVMLGFVPFPYTAFNTNGNENSES